MKEWRKQRLKGILKWLFFSLPQLILIALIFIVALLEFGELRDRSGWTLFLIGIILVENYWLQGKVKKLEKRFFRS
jgi:hypothetical protein